MDVGEREPVGQDADLNLPGFFPYRLALLAETVSHSMAQLYADRFEMTRHEWRIVAALGNRKRLAGRDVGRLTTLDKMQVSRALSGLEERGLVTRIADPLDRRNHILALTPAGRSLYQKVVPLVRAREEYILSALNEGEAKALDGIMTKLQARTEDLLRRG